MRKTIVMLGVVFVVLALVAVPCQAAKKGQVELAQTVGYSDFSQINGPLAAQGSNVRLYMMEYTTAPDSGQLGGAIFARNVGNKQLSAHWVAYDPLRRGDSVITYEVDQVDLTATGGATEAQLEGAIDSAMNTWNSQDCSFIPIVKTAGDPSDLGYVQYLLGYGGFSGFPNADITDAGWLPGEFFDLLAEGGSSSILGVTFTFIWYEGGDPTDMDGNGKNDVAFREIYYNNAFEWSVNGPTWDDPAVDVETIVLHETGHGLSQAHFGKIFVDSSWKGGPLYLSHLHFSPRAVMNAMYWDTQRSLLGGDVGGHCSIWASWPNN